MLERMTRAISKQDFLENADSLLEADDRDTLVISKDGRPVRAVMPWDEYEAIRQVKAQGVIDAMMAFRQYMQTEATAEERAEMESAFERSAP